MHQRCDPRNLGDDVRNPRDLSTRHGTGRQGRKDIHDTVIDNAVEVLGVPVTQKLESTPEPLWVASKGG